MKLLVLAQTPPPLHGQSLMVRTLVDGLPAHGIALHHVNLPLSRDHADIGRPRLGKIFTALAAAFRAIAARRHCDTLYYIPAPGKRSALLRDWLVLGLCRPFYGRLVLHFHNGGLADWLSTRATAPERWLTRLFLGRATLALVLTPSLRVDAEYLKPHRIAVVPNGIVDPCPDGAPPPPASTTLFQILFLGAVTTEKGADTLLDAHTLLRARGLDAHVTLAGPCTDATLLQKIAAAGPTVRHAGFVTGEAKEKLFAACHVVCLPTHYAHEAQPLVALEALAHDRPIVATKWRGLPETAPPGTPLVPPRDPAALAEALGRFQDEQQQSNRQRDFYLGHYTVHHHLRSLAAVLLSL